MADLVRLKNNKYRTLLSEVLPYEKPLFFTNRYFYRLVNYYGIKVTDGKLVATKHKEIISIILDLICPNSKLESFQYNIAKSVEKEGRTLSVIHPLYQIMMSEYYEKYKNCLLENCSKSSYSIRFPYKVATFKKKEADFESTINDIIKDENPDELRKNYFSYKYFSNINDFFDKDRFLRAEAQFENLYKLDLKECFDSIKPSIISKALYGKKINQCYGTFVRDFYDLECLVSPNGSNKGIVIGPEFSRIYAELILQMLDVKLEKRVFDKYSYEPYKDYILYRYVDDYYLFYNEQTDNASFIDNFLKEFNCIINDYHLRLNKEKSSYLGARPFLTNISSCKSKLIKLLDLTFQNQLETVKGLISISKNKEITPISFNHIEFVKGVRTIISDSNDSNYVEYKEIMSFLLGLMKRRIISLSRDFSNIHSDYVEAAHLYAIDEKGEKIRQLYEYKYLDFSKNLLRSIFFLFACDMRMATSVKLVSIIDVLQSFIRGELVFEDGSVGKRFNNEIINAFDREIVNQTRWLYAHVKFEKYNTMELLTLLEVQKRMSNNIKISSAFLQKKLINIKTWNFFTIFQVLHFIEDDERFSEMKTKLKELISEKVKNLILKNEANTENVLTFLEVMSCPYISPDYKFNLLSGSKNESLDSHRREIILFFQKNQNFFIKWNKYTLSNAIKTISNTPVY